MTAKQENEEPLRSAYGDTAESSSWKSSRETPQLAIETRKVKKEEPKPTLIDLTSTEDGDDDVQRAIALSLQDAVGLEIDTRSNVRISSAACLSTETVSQIKVLTDSTVSRSEYSIR